MPPTGNETPSTDIAAPAAVSLGFSAPALTAEFMRIHYGHRMSFAAGEQSEIEKIRLKLLHIVFENIGVMSPEEQWLKGLMDALVLASQPPLTLRRLDEAERRLKDVMFKQKVAKKCAKDAQEEMLKMLATFVERLSDMICNTGSLQEKLVENSRQIAQAKTIACHDSLTGALNPQYALARFGREELIILIPDTPVNKGVEAMTRPQRDLTTRFFLAGTDKILITFSAGVAQLTEGETGADAIKRADQAMYLAKRAGKNRVLAA